MIEEPSAQELDVGSPHPGLGIEMSKEESHSNGGLGCNDTEQLPGIDGGSSLHELEEPLMCDVHPALRGDPNPRSLQLWPDSTAVPDPWRNSYATLRNEF